MPRPWGPVLSERYRAAGRAGMCLNTARLRLHCTNGHRRRLDPALPDPSGVQDHGLGTGPPPLLSPFRTCQERTPSMLPTSVQAFIDAEIAANTTGFSDLRAVFLNGTLKRSPER